MRTTTERSAIDRPTTDRDADLLEALRRRDATAAESLVSVFGDRAYRLAMGITGTQQDAEEAVQDAFWNVIRKIATFRGMLRSAHGPPASAPASRRVHGRRNVGGRDGLVRSDKVR